MVFNNTHILRICLYTFCEKILYYDLVLISCIIKGTVMQIEKPLTNDRLRVSKVSGKFRNPIIYNFAVIYL